MLADEATITIKAGNGGPGKASFFPGNKSGPSGGNGGKGGDVIVVLDRGLSSLNRYLTKQSFKADNGRPGGSFLKDGSAADDLLLPVPAGTHIYDENTGEEWEIDETNPQVVLLRGGRGGRGNAAFKSSLFTTPRKTEPGEEGRSRTVKLIMKLIAQIGFIGLPNAGKSSLLNALTNAGVRTANYPFTTLEPNLGVMDSLVIADIPGLIEGASSGRGLGIKFLKHIEKVSLLVHCISADSEDYKKPYEIVREELERFNPELLNKHEVVLITKSDLVSDEQIHEKIHAAGFNESETQLVSIIDDKRLLMFRSFLLNLNQTSVSSTKDLE